jgi:deoxyribose-phosphate aldolase
MDKSALAFYLDFANHHADTGPADIRSLCQKVEKYGFHSAFVNPCWIALAKEILGDVTVGTVVSFPLGQDSQDSKVLAAMDAARRGADELDISINVGLFKAGQHQLVLAEMKAVVGSVKTIRSSALVKFIIETGFLTDSEIRRAAQLVLKSGADFVKTNSGWGPRGASLKDVGLIRTAVGDKIKLKVAGGIDTYKKAISFIEAGADRIGTSKAVEIIKGVK